MSPLRNGFDDTDLGLELDEVSRSNGDRSTNVGVIEPKNGDSAESAEWSGPRCEKCAAPLRSDVVTVCRSCGWYASLGTFVEVDPKWETEEREGGATEPAPQPSHLRVWFELVPWWGWVIIGSVAAVVVESIIVRLVTGPGSSLRMTWSIIQLAIGVFALLGGHIFNFLVQVADDADVGLFDVVLKPIKLWLRTFRILPSRLWAVDTAATGLAAAVMSIVVIGSLPYDRLWDWGFTPPPKAELMGAIMDRVKEMDDKGADNLEDAIDDFAGKAGLDDKVTPQKPRKTADCVILGYTVDKEGVLNTLVLGTAHLGRLVYAGNVTPKLKDETERAEMLAMLAAARTPQRLIAVETEAIWVKPTITCRVTYGDRQPTGRLSDLEWEAFLGKMRTQSKSKR
jgi:hypothetical protein